MERLTYRSPLGNAVSYGACEDVVCTVRDCDKCKVGAMTCRLCAYEDTGLEPEEIIRLKREWKTVCNLYGINTVSPTLNDPLTLEELREMDGEPVWCEKFGWRICYGITIFLGCQRMETGAGSCILLDDYGKTWLAYRRKPEEGTI